LLWIGNPKLEALFMAQALDPSELVTFKELIITNSIQLDTITQLLIEKGLITYDEFTTKLKTVQAEYVSRKQ
jgi:hypothetical protein